MTNSKLKNQDLEIYEIIKGEESRQQQVLSMIASENFASPAVREALGSVFTNKYSEGYPGARYYEGNTYADKLERLAIERAKELFKLPEGWGVNVQAHSGSPANLSVYIGLLEVGDKILGMYLPDGGHLSHGWSYEPDAEGVDHSQIKYDGGRRKVNITSKCFEAVQYKTDPETQLFNYEKIAEIARATKPKLIITGGTAYPREIDYKKMRAIADEVGAYYLADIAHEAGLIASGVNASPVGIADVVTFTTHKTLRCNRGAIILGKDEMIKKINRAIFPGLQGGPHNHSIAGIAVGLAEAMKPEFKEYSKQVVKNAQHLCAKLIDKGFDIVSGGTDKHLFLIDMSKKEILGKKFSRALALGGIIANKNTIPQESNTPADPSGVRLGTPWITTRGMKEAEMDFIANWISEVYEAVKGFGNDMPFKEFRDKVTELPEIKRIAGEVSELCGKFPLDI